MATSAYIHIPFCKQKCKYCSFVSFPCIQEKDEYLKSLTCEIKSKYQKETLQTLYFGGGTPSLLTLDEIQSLLYLFNIDKSAEITLEINPETVDVEYLKGIKSLGINRLSIGCQSFDDEILKNIGRLHNARQVENIVKQAQNNGVRNISLDFIYGLPNQTQESFVNDLNKALLLDITHISLYGLKIEEGSYFYQHKPSNIANADEQADMYLSAIKTLTDNKFEHYEISNFSKHNFHSRHNLNYWNNKTYYGFGVAAHGYLNNVRYSNPISMNEYIQNPNSPIWETKLSDTEKLEEEIFLGFRKCNGIEIDYINDKFNIDFERKYSKILNKFLKSGHLIQTKCGYRLSNEGILLSNIILSEFLED